jgi:hypothetical protein
VPDQREDQDEENTGRENRSLTLTPTHALETTPGTPNRPRKRSVARAPLRRAQWSTYSPWSRSTQALRPGDGVVTFGQVGPRAHSDHAK